MKKRIALSLVLVLIVSLLAGCAGTAVVYYGNCTCAPGSHGPSQPETPAEGAVKTGLALITKASSVKPGEYVEYDVTLVAVTVDDHGVIDSCLIDSIGTKVEFDGTGTLTKVPENILSKNELGDDYGMVAWGGAKSEWNEQAAAFAAYVTGKTAAEVAGIAITDSTKPADGSDLSSSVTISIGGFQALIAKALGK